MTVLPRLRIPWPRPATLPSHRGRTARARRTVLLAVAAVLFAQIGLSVGLETIRPQWRDPEFGWRLKAIRELDRTRGERPLVVAFGSSRTQMGLSPRHLGFPDGPPAPAVFSFGQAGGGPLHHLLNLRRLLDAGVRPSAVLIEMMVNTVGQEGTAEQFVRETTSRLSLADIERLKPYCENVHTLHEQWLGYRLLPWHTSRLMLVNHACPSWLPWQQRVDFQWHYMDERGWAAYPFETISDAERERQTAHTRKQLAHTLDVYRIAPLPDRVLRDLLTLCRDRNISAALYRMPEGPLVRELYPPATMAKFEAYLQTLHHDFGVPVFDATTWLPEERFTDGHHQLPGGAKMFSERFGRECLNPWLTSCKLIGE